MAFGSTPGSNRTGDILATNRDTTKSPRSLTVEASLSVPAQSSKTECHPSPIFYYGDLQHVAYC